MINVTLTQGPSLRSVDRNCGMGILLVSRLHRRRFNGLNIFHCEKKMVKQRTNSPLFLRMFLRNVAYKKKWALHHVSVAAFRSVW